jgi:hypothetical protein
MLQIVNDRILSLHYPICFYRISPPIIAVLSSQVMIFVLENSIIVGSQIKDWADIKDGQHYILVSSQYGILYRRVYSRFSK